MPESAIPSGQATSDRWWHASFGLLLALTFGTFTLWAIGEVDQSAHYGVLILTIIFGFFMAFNIGGNDVANSFGTSVGAGTLTMKQALMIAAVFEVGGAILAGGDVTETVRSGIVDLDSSMEPMTFVYIMMSSLLGAAIWLLVATRMGWPVSTTHAIIGGIVGAALCVGFRNHSGGWEMVQWDQIGQIVISWFLSPVLGMAAAYLLYGTIKRNILVYNEAASAKLQALQEERFALKNRHKESFERLSEAEQIAYNNAMARDAVTAQREGYRREDLESEYYRGLYDIEARAKEVDSHRALERWVPLLAALGAIIITAMMLFKGLKNLHLNIDNMGNLLIMGMIGAAVWMAVFVFARTVKRHDLDRSTFLLFSWLQVFTAAAFAFSHGSNDIANAVGPFAAVLDVLKTDSINAKAEVPAPVLLGCGIALVCGLWFIGRTVIVTVGTGLTKMHPASGFAAELAAATVVMAASLFGLPVSSTHILIGAVLGVGVVNRSANWRLMRPIGLAWIITIPAAAGIGAVGVIVLEAIF
ncbi:inorganic phosphate transporter [Corynebacterium sp. zg-331]|uniref:inorganic phosphate transporter n=1 Tax=unclassified Corynebacterium TaxID=2624378 RepID=UPI00128CD74D|nr:MULTISPECIES: inorganic phosphate transporter [unclassified Corynebacterium]MBC3185862.1 inorganic phosphate transporter [Corynebacterium sp. zg-331]MPV52353.1 phosphate permease [Corynebacterium sp. zg331]